MLADLFLAELDRQEHVAPSVEMLGRELAKQLKQTQETLALIAALYVRAERELADLSRVSSRGDRSEPTHPLPNP